MTKQQIIGASGAAVAIGGILVYFIVHTMNQQSDTQQQLDALRRQMAAATMPAPATGTAGAPMAGPVVALPSMPADGSLLARQKVTQEYLSEGFRLLNTRTPENARQAAKIFQEGIDKADSKNVFFYNGLGRAFLISGQPAEALQAFQKGHELDPGRAELVSGEGWAYWNQKQYAEAKRAWEKAVAMDPKSQDAWMTLAWIYLDIGDFENAKKGFVILQTIDGNRKEWIDGLNMARGSTPHLDQIRAEYPGMPEPAAFQSPASAPLH